MVVFTCNSCGESLHKKRVEKHQFQCRNFGSVTCVDCFKDFHNDEYKAHVKCISEEERYAAKGTPKEQFVQKGAVKQESWMEMIKSICDNDLSLKAKTKSLLQKIANFSNVPRKKNKFMNFMQNCLKGQASNKDIDELWNVIEKYKTDSSKLLEGKENIRNPTSNNKISNQLEDTGKAGTPTNNTNQSSQKRKCSVSEEGNSVDPVDSHDIPSKKKKKNSKKEKENETISEKSEENGDLQNKTDELNKHVSEQITTADSDQIPSKKNKKNSKKEKVNESINQRSEKNGDVQQTDELDNQPMVVFNFQEKILEILNKKNSISLETLQKKVLKSYRKIVGTTDSSDKSVKKFNKKLHKIPNIQIDNNIVTLNK